MSTFELWQFLVMILFLLGAGGFTTFIIYCLLTPFQSNWYQGFKWAESVIKEQGKHGCNTIYQNCDEWFGEFDRGALDYLTTHSYKMRSQDD